MHLPCYHFGRMLISICLLWFPMYFLHLNFMYFAMLLALIGHRSQRYSCQPISRASSPCDWLYGHKLCLWQHLVSTVLNLTRVRLNVGVVWLSVESLNLNGWPRGWASELWRLASRFEPSKPAFSPYSSLLQFAAIQHSQLLCPS